MSTARKGGAEGPSPFATLFAWLRHRHAPMLAAATGAMPALPAPPPASPPDPPPLPAVIPQPPFGPHPSRTGPNRQMNLLNPPRSPRHADRTIFLRDFAARFRQVVRRQGVERGDPLAPVLDMLAEMLVHFSGVAEDLHTDLNMTLEHLDGRFQRSADQAANTISEETAKLRKLVSEVAAWLEAVTQETRQQRAHVQTGFIAETRQLLTDTVIRQAGVRIWRDRMIVAGIVTLLVGGAYWVGLVGGREEIRQAAAAGGNKIEAALLQDGPDAEQHWLDLMQWNRIDTVYKTCDRQAYGHGDRQACTYAFWDRPPPDDPPAPKP